MPLEETTPDVDTTDLTLFQQEILYILADHDTEYGLGVKRALEERYGEEVNHGRLYPNLDQVVEMGLVEKSELDKRTNEYELTPEGRLLVRSDAQRRYTIADGLNERFGGDD